MKDRFYKNTHTKSATIYMANGDLIMLCLTDQAAAERIDTMKNLNPGSE